MKNQLTNLTILVNSCDAYSDLWDPFFKLFKKYGRELTKCKIILNADNLQYSYPGLNIECPNHYDQPQPWGKRVKNCLDYIKTDYVFWLLDDFFLQRDCDISIIEQCAEWLDKNKNIGAFNLLSLKQSEDESKLFPHFCFITPNTDYRFNSQACIWNKKILYTSIDDSESPWEWEILGNLRNNVLMKNTDIYCISELYPEPYFYNSEFHNKKYSPDVVRNAIIRGKWDPSCIDKCFKDNDIYIDYSIRGLYHPKTSIWHRFKHKIYNFLHIKKYLMRKKNEKQRYYELVSKPIVEYNKKHD